MSRAGDERVHLGQGSLEPRRCRAMWAVLLRVPGCCERQVLWAFKLPRSNCGGMYGTGPEGLIWCWGCWGSSRYLPYETAKVTRNNTNGGYHVRIEHAPLPDVTPQQLQWFFENIGGESRNPSDGEIYPNYLLM